MKEQLNREEYIVEIKKTRSLKEKSSKKEKNY